MLKKLTGAPWIADLRDLWTQDSLMAWPSRWHYRLTVFAERLLLRNADAVIANTPLAAERMRALLGPQAHVVAVPNGYDSDEIVPSVRRAVEQGDEEPIIIAHMGTFHDPPADTARLTFAQRLRRSYRPVKLDPWLRTPKALFDGMRELIARQPEAREKFRLLFIGYLDDRWRRIAADSGLNSMLDAPGYLAHGEAMKRLANADILLCVQVGFADAKKPVPYVPAKLYEYLAAGKPILAPVAEGDTKEVLRQSGLAVFADPHDPADVARALREMLEMRRGKREQLTPNWDYIRQHERRETARKLAELFDVTGGLKIL